MPLPDAPNEEQTTRDGLLSYAGEWHALSIGLTLGLIAGYTEHEAVFLLTFLIISGRAKTSNTHLSDAVKEAAYTAGGFTVAFALAFVYL